MMNQETAIKLFESRQIRTVWDEDEEERYFSVVDVGGVLTDCITPAAYLRKLKQRLKEEGNETVTVCHGLKLLAADGKMRNRFKFKKLKIIFIVLLILTAGSIVICDNIINKTTDHSVYSDINKIPYNKTGLILGTSKYLKSGQPNMYFANRITAAVELYNAGKIEFFVISGDNSRKSYNEPLDMKNELIRNGVPENKIFLDYAGFRTYDSVIRINKIFEQTAFTVISQEFHNRRAVYIAKRLGLQAVGFNAKDVSAYNGFKTKVREKFARVKVFIDFLIDREPKFLGDKIEIK